MKTIFALITFAALSLGSCLAQNSNNDQQMSVNNYKHANKAKKAAQTDTRANMTGEEVSLRSQRIHKVVKRNYILAPANDEVATNVQGQKVKANYKSQF